MFRFNICPNSYFILVFTGHKIMRVDYVRTLRFQDFLPTIPKGIFFYPISIVNIEFQSDWKKIMKNQYNKINNQKKKHGKSCQKFCALKINFWTYCEANCNLSNRACPKHTQIDFPSFFFHFPLIFIRISKQERLNKPTFTKK